MAASRNRISSSHIKELQTILGISEEDCILLIEEYGKDVDDTPAVIQAVYETIETTQLKSVEELVWNLRKNPCFGRKLNNTNYDNVNGLKDSWSLARSKSSNTISKHITGLPISTQQSRPASATAQMERNDLFNQPLPYSTTRYPVRILRSPKNVDASQLRTYLSKYMQDKEMSDFLYEMFENGGSKKTLILMRGASGSGKSTLATLLWAITERGEICSADHYFVCRNGEYRFNRNNLGEAHETCKTRCRNAMNRGDTPIIIDNTNTKTEEMIPYVHLAIQFNYDIKLLEPNTEWKRKAGILAAKTVHSVPKKTIEDQLDRFEKTTVRAMVSKVLKRHGIPACNYKPNQELSWGETPSSPLTENWMFHNSTLNPATSVAAAVTNSPHKAQRQRTSTPTLLPAPPPQALQQQLPWSDPIPVGEPAPRLLSDLVPDLKSGNTTPKPRRNGKKNSNGNGNMPPAAASSTTNSPVKPIRFEDPAHAAFKNLRKLFPTVEKDKLEATFNTHDGDLDACANALFEEGYDMTAATDFFEDPVDEITLIDQLDQMLLEEKREEQRKRESGIDVTGASGSTSDQESKRLSSVTDSEEFESLPSVFDSSNSTERSVAGAAKPVEMEPNTFELLLPPDFARGLLSAFGHPDDENRSLSQDEMNIKIGADIAFELYKSLYINMHNMENDIVRSNSEESTRSSSPASGFEDDGEFDEMAVSFCQMELETSSQDPSLAAIMDIESKITRETEKALRCFSAPYRTMAQNINFSLLKQEYPHLDAAVIDEIFSHCCLDMDKTRATLNEICPPASVPQATTSKPAVESESSWSLKYNPKDIQLYSPEELKSMQKTYDELEREWTNQMVKMREYHVKCKTEQNPQIKAHYIIEAKRLSESMKALSDEMQYYKAISQNARHNNDQILDLHGLRVTGAIKVLKEFLQFKEQEFRKAGTPKMILLIITGQGKHSKNNSPVLQPAVKNFLIQRKYKFHSAKPGSYTVILTRGTIPGKK